MFRYLLLPAALLLCLPLFSQQEIKSVDNTVREDIEWANLWWAHAPDTKLPRVLLIGDSVTNGYHNDVDKLLKGKVNVDMVATSANICDPALLAQVRLAVGGYKHAVIHFNNGLHGWQLDDAAYEAGLSRLIALLRELSPQAKLVWGHSTPIVLTTDPATLDPKNAAVIRRNEIAARVMQELGIPVDDTYSVSVGHPEYRNVGDGYHYNQQGKTAQAEAVAKAIIPLLP